ncbi:uncharacterized protein C8Q71DRAFT_725311 [Rhodofomes roseus]|uniref:Secreted protein n=1 Tax=Rhodofomes roseus TaxID=34475 RepID=A0A4Y9YFC2_9APHY|nr:uncharacterized protein C8Q71DRAFT_725311 [Rhodofomes roseus]KAH9834103.1 hypothetical protein C8Q71DRAFT_725311 [Rhodofomes roseus]TFY60902.1 hypothetical protein EVJ58_g4854 [Rhodofomes roseus]
MVATFILTRAFAVCAMIVGVPLAHAAPIVSGSVAQRIDERNCRLLGCLFAAPNAHTSDADVSSLSGTADAMPEVAYPSAGTESSSGSRRVAHIIAKVLSDIEATPSSDSVDDDSVDAYSAVTRDMDAAWAELLPELESLEK